MKKCAFCNVGTRGDLQPLVALALSFRGRDWDVVIISEERSRPLAEDFGLAFRAVAGDSTGIIFEEEYAEMLAKGKFMAMLQETERRKKGWYDQALNDWVETTTDVQMIVCGPLVISETFCVAEKLGIPWIPMLYGPLYPTCEFPNPFLMESNWFYWLNRFTYDFIYWALWQQQGSDVNAFRSRLGLEPLRGRRGIMSEIEEKKLLVIGAFHEVLIPTLKVPSDWPEHFFFQNFCFVPRTAEKDLDVGLQRFLEGKASEAKMIYMGLGSMPTPRPQELMDLALKIVRELKVKAVVCAGWSNVSQQGSDEILVLKSVPHDVVFPKCQVIMHHAGVGTCGAALRAGVPSVCLPVMLDQFHNARHLKRLGVATEPLPFAQLTNSQDLLLESLRQALESQEMRKEAQEISRKIESASDGAASCAQKILETYPQ